MRVAVHALAGVELGPHSARVLALVTGGGSGLRTMMAAALVQNGAKVYIASRKEKQLKEVRCAPCIVFFMLLISIVNLLDRRWPEQNGPRKLRIYRS